MLRNFAILIFGIIFGFALSRVGASDYDLIFKMFAGENLKLAWVIITAILVAFLGMRILAATGNKGFKDEEITVNKKPFNKYTIWGGILFGIGWAISGACPGTVLAQVGEGKILGLFTMLGLMAGTYVYALIAQNNPNLK